MHKKVILNLLLSIYILTDPFKDYVAIHLRLIQIDTLEVVILLIIHLVDYVFQTNMITGINESKLLTKQISCKCKCKFYRTKCISSRKSNSNKCRCECKILKNIVCAIYIYIYIYIYTDTCLGLPRTHQCGSSVCQNACGVVNEQKIFGVLLNALVKMKNIQEVLFKIQRLHVLKLQKEQKPFQKKLFQQKML